MKKNVFLSAMMVIIAALGMSACESSFDELSELKPNEVPTPQEPEVVYDWFTPTGDESNGKTPVKVHFTKGGDEGFETSTAVFTLTAESLIKRQSETCLVAESDIQKGVACTANGTVVVKYRCDNDINNNLQATGFTMEYKGKTLSCKVESGLVKGKHTSDKVEENPFMEESHTDYQLVVNGFKVATATQEFLLSGEYVAPEIVSYDVAFKHIAYIDVDKTHTFVSNELKLLCDNLAEVSANWNDGNKTKEAEIPYVYRQVFRAAVPTAEVDAAIIGKVYTGSNGNFTVDGNVISIARVNGSCGATTRIVHNGTEYTAPDCVAVPTTLKVVSFTKALITFVDNNETIVAELPLNFREKQEPVEPENEVSVNVNHRFSGDNIIFDIAITNTVDKHNDRTYSKTMSLGHTLKAESKKVYTGIDELKHTGALTLRSETKGGKVANNDGTVYAYAYTRYFDHANNFGSVTITQTFNSDFVVVVNGKEYQVNVNKPAAANAKGLNSNGTSVNNTDIVTAYAETYTSIYETSTKTAEQLYEVKGEGIMFAGEKILCGNRTDAYNEVLAKAEGTYDCLITQVVATGAYKFRYRKVGATNWTVKNLSDAQATTMMSFADASADKALACVCPTAGSTNWTPGTLHTFMESNTRVIMYYDYGSTYAYCVDVINAVMSGDKDQPIKGTYKKVSTTSNVGKLEMTDGTTIIFVDDLN